MNDLFGRPIHADSQVVTFSYGGNRSHLLIARVTELGERSLVKLRTAAGRDITRNRNEVVVIEA